MIDGTAHDAAVWAQAINSHTLVEYSKPGGGDEPVDLADADQVCLRTWVDDRSVLYLSVRTL